MVFSQSEIPLMPRSTLAVGFLAAVAESRRVTSRGRLPLSRFARWLGSYMRTLISGLLAKWTVSTNRTLRSDKFMTRE
jgi:hypothetical protein